MRVLTKCRVRNQKLTQHQVRYIRNFLAAQPDEPLTFFAEKFGVSTSAIYDVSAYRTYRNVISPGDKALLPSSDAPLCGEVLYWSYSKGWSVQKIADHLKANPLAVRNILKNYYSEDLCGKPLVPVVS